MLGDMEAEGDTDAEGLILRDAEAEGDTEADGEIDGLTDADGLTEGDTPLYSYAPISGTVSCGTALPAKSSERETFVPALMAGESAWR